MPQHYQRIHSSESSMSGVPNSIFDTPEGVAAPTAALDKELERPAKEVYPGTVLLGQVG